MRQQIKNPEKIIELLINLLDKEQKERETISADFHGKKSDLLIINWLLAAIDKDAEQGKFNPDSLKEPQKMLSAAMEDMRQISYEIFPKMVHMSGLHVGLKQMVLDGLLKYGLEIDYTTNLKERLPTKKSKEAAIYRICIDLLEYFQLQGNSEIGLEVTLTNNILTLMMVGLTIKNSMHPKSEIDEKLNIAKARLIWQHAIVDAETNWKNLIKVSFNL
jgi:signal transduction histidine kinase